MGNSKPSMRFAPYNTVRDVPSGGGGFRLRASIRRGERFRLGCGCRTVTRRQLSEYWTGGAFWQRWGARGRDHGGDLGGTKEWAP